MDIVQESLAQRTGQIVPESKSRWFTDTNKRQYLLLKSNLIDLFTIADLPVVNYKHGEIKDRRIGDIVKYEDYEYAGYTFISIPQEDLNKINIFDVVHTVKYGEDLTKYKENNIYVCDSNNIAYKLTKINLYTNTQEDPDSESYSLELKSKLVNISQYASLTFLKLGEKNQFRGYDLFTDKQYVFGVDYTASLSPSYIVLSKYGTPAFHLYETFTLHSGDIENYNNTTNDSIVTSFGRYLANYFLLAKPFGNVINYVNDKFDFGDIEKTIATKINSKEISVSQGGEYLDNALFIGSFGEMAIPGITRKSLTTTPEMQKKKKELLEKYKDQLDDPLVTSQIEDELIKLDKEWLKGDDSMGFYGDDAKKKFGVNRKKQYVMVGTIEDFSKDKGKYDFIPNSLAEGWDINSFASISNEIRKGSYNRGAETAKGGYESKKIMRIMQNIKLISDDCGTKEYLTVLLSENIIDKFYNRYVVDDSGKLVLLTKENKDQFLNKRTRIRSLMYCKQVGGYCFTCAGAVFKNTEQDVLGVLALEITSKMMNIAMKNMHGKKLSHETITDLNKYLI